MSKACSNCGAQNADEAKFCRACGKAFELPPLQAPFADDSTIIGTPCRVCGHINRPGIRFCAKCGADQVPPAQTPPDSEATVFMQPLADATVIMPRVQPPAPDPYYPAPPPEPEPYSSPAEPAYAPPPETYYSTATEPYAPMPTGPGSLPPAVHDSGAATARSMMLWIGLAVVLLIVIAAAIWWFMQSQPAVVNTFDAAPPPSVLAASSPAASPAEDLRPASAPDTSAALPADAASGAMPAASAPGTPAPDSFDNGASAPAIGTTLAPVPSESASAASTAAAPVDAAAAKEAAAKDKAAREAKAKALREQRLAAASQAAVDAARKRADESRPRSPPIVAGAATPPPAPAPAAPVVAQSRTVADVCTSGNSLVRGICEARECVGSEHANEDICRRIRAADDRRRQ